MTSRARASDEKNKSFAVLMDQWASARGVAIFFLLYGLAHGLVTRVPGPALALDDVKLNIVTQSLQRGYMPENPPLFEWTLIAVQAATGPTLLSFIIVKYAFLAVAGVFTYLAAREVLTDRPWAALTAGSLILLYQIGWNYHQAFTHSAALIACVAVFWHALFRVLKAGAWRDYAFLGLALGLGALSKYSFLAVAPIALAVAAAAAPFRERIFSWRLALSFVVALFVIAPHLAWLATENADVAASTATRLQGDDASYWARIAGGLPQALWAIASYFLVFAPIAFGLFGAKTLDPRTRLGGLAGVARWATIFGAGALVLAVLALGMDGMQERYAIPFLFPVIFSIAAACKDVGAADAMRRLAFIIICVAIAGPGLRLVEAATAGAPFCKKCRQWIPYDPLAKAITDNGFETRVLVGLDDHIAGNLRRLFPQARVVSAHMPFYAPPQRAGQTACVFVWAPDIIAPSPALLKRLETAPVIQIEAPWRHPLKKNGWRVTHWHIVSLDADPALAKSLCRL